MKDDQILVARCKSGDNRAFSELVRRYEKKVYYFALRFVGDYDEAWDLAQEVFIRAYRGIGKFRGGCAFKTWLYTIAGNLLKNHYRNASRHPIIPLGEREIRIEGNGMESLLDRETRHLLNVAIAELPYKQRMALTLRIEEGLSHREIAEILGCTEGSAKVNFHHALNSLRKRVVSEIGGNKVGL